MRHPARLRAPQAQLHTELERIVQDVRDYRAQVDSLLAEMGAEQPEAVRQAARMYLNQLPGRVQSSLRRPDDPRGLTVPAGLALRHAEDLKLLLPERMPRFQTGSRPVPGTDLVVQELIGVGGFGEVWKAVHHSRPHAPPVALKFCTDEAAARMLRKEVELLDRVSRQGRHHGIVELRYAHLECNPPCLEYEYVDGGDLAELVTDLHRAGQASPLQMTRLFYSLAQAVGVAHRIQPPVVHRDLKPANVKTTKVENHFVLKVLDFGIGGLAAEQAQRTASETIRNSTLTQSVGSCTPLYASPQQRGGGSPDLRDDVYSLGVIWYQMLIGDTTKEPPRGGSWKKRLLDHGATADMIGLLERCLEDDPAERPADAHVVAEELRAIIKAATPMTKKAAVPPPLPTAEQWYYTRDGKQEGPIPFEEMLSRTAAGIIRNTDQVWTARLGSWVQAGSIPGLCPSLPPVPPPISGPPPMQNINAGTQARVRFMVPTGNNVAHMTAKAIRGYVKLATYGLMGGKVFGSDILKFYLGNRLLGSGPLVEGFNFEVPFSPGRYSVAVAHWVGSHESDRKEFDLSFDKPGEYQVRFNYVRGVMGGMSGSTIEILRGPI